MNAPSAITQHASTAGTTLITRSQLCMDREAGGWRCWVEVEQVVACQGCVYTGVQGKWVVDVACCASATSRWEQDV